MMNTFLKVPNQSASNLHTPVLFGEILIGSNTIVVYGLKNRPVVVTDWLATLSFLCCKNDTKF